jgi:ribosomal-protein-alanine N-acetyltransferase
MRALTYRRGKPSDLDRLLELERDFPSDRLSRRSIRRFLARTNVDVWVGARSQQVIGNAVVLYRRDTAGARLYSLVVAPGARRYGVATGLIRAVEAAARRRGCDRVCLEVRIDNRAAIRLYEKLKYRIVRRLPRFYDDGQDALRFERRVIDTPRVVVTDLAA